MTMHRTKRPKTAWFAAFLAAVSLVPGGPLAAQDGEEEDLSVEGLYRKAGELIQNNQHKEASEVFQRMIDLSGGYETLVEDYGAQAGGIMFDYGMTLLPQKKWDDAAKAFQDCINADKMAKEIPSPLSNSNPREKLAQFQLGFCMAQMNKHKEALELYDAYLASKPPQNELMQIRNGFTLRYGTSQMKLGQIEEGLATIQKLFDNQQAWKVSPAFLAQGILEVGKVFNENGLAAGEDADKRDQIENDALAFLEKNGKILTMQPYDLLQFGVVDRLKTLGFEATKSGMYSLALRYLSMVPTSNQIKRDIDARVREMKERGVPGIPPKLEAFLKLVEEKEKSPVHPDVEVMRLMASCYERIGNKYAPRTIYWHISEKFPGLPLEKRAEVLHEAARFSAELRDYSAAQYFGEKFMDEMPEDHPLRNNVATFMIQSLFSNGDHETVVKIAEDVRTRYELGDRKRELADALYPLSLYSLRRHEDAKAPFDDYAKAYEDTPNREMVVYHRASNSLVLQDFRRSAEQIEDFLKEFPESPKFYENALSDLAVSRFNLEDYEAAIAAADELLEKKPESIHLARTLNVRGDAYMVKFNDATKEQEDEKAGWRKEALESHLGAIEAGKRAQATGKSPDYYKAVVAEGLWKSADIYITDGNCDEALKQYDTFMAGYTGVDPWEGQISVFSLECLEEANRVDEGLTQVEKMIVKEGNKDPEIQDLQFLREMIGSYSEASVRNRGAEKTMATMENFPGASPDNQVLLTWLKIQNVIILQELKKGMESDSPEAKEIDAKVDKMFTDLAQFEKRNLSEYALQQIGVYFANSDNPYQAKPFFEALLNRANPEADAFKGSADLELGKLEMRESDPALLTSARERFRRIIFNYKDKELTPVAWLQLGRLHVQTGSWTEGIEAFDKINKNKSWFKNDRVKRAEATFFLGHCYEKDGNEAAAAQAYLATWSVYGGYPTWVCQAFEAQIPISLKNFENLPQNDPLQIADKRLKELAFYELFVKQLYVWQKWNDEDDPSGAINRLRRMDNTSELKTKLAITPEEEKQIYFNLGLDPPGTQENN